jgi:hypothetical protein
VADLLAPFREAVQPGSKAPRAVDSRDLWLILFSKGNHNKSFYAPPSSGILPLALKSCSLSSLLLNLSGLRISLASKKCSELELEDF